MLGHIAHFFLFTELVIQMLELVSKRKSKLIAVTYYHNFVWFKSRQGGSEQDMKIRQTDTIIQ